MPTLLFLLDANYINLEAEKMSENFNYQLQQMTNEELIDFALEHTGQEYEDVRTALQEYFLRIKDDPNIVTDPPGDIEILRLQLERLQNQ